MKPLFRFALAWDILILVFATLLGIFVPIHIVMHTVLSDWMPIGNILLSSFFVIDIIFTFQKIRIGRKTRALARPLTQKSYLQRFFIFDLLATIPFSLFPGLRGLAILRLAKLVHVGRLMYVWRHVLYRFQNTLGILTLLYWMLLGIHWLACGWLWLRGAEPDMTTWENYTDALYWCVTTITTVGFGDITPETISEKWYAILVMILGLAFTSYFIGYVASKLLNRDPASSMYYENLERLGQIVSYRGLPSDLQGRIYEYYTYIWRKQTGYFEADFLESLPPGLKREVTFHLKKEVIERVPLFADLGEGFQEEVSLMLQSRVIAPGERVVKIGDEGDKMYFIVRGTLDVLNASGDLLNQLNDGDFFGEISLFLAQKRTAEIRSVDYCDVYTLSKHSLEIVTRKYPEIKTRIEAKIEARMASDLERDNGQAG